MERILDYHENPHIREKYLDHCCNYNDISICEKSQFGRRSAVPITEKHYILS